MNKFKKLVIPFAIAVITQANATEIKIKVENLTQAGGVFLTPLWVGFHDGSFDSYSLGEPASSGIERIGEDGDPSELRAIFSGFTSTGQDAVIFNPEGFAGAPVFEPGSSSTAVYNLDETNQRYFSYANMVIPSNDAFVGNDNPLEHMIFNENGDFMGPFSFIVYGKEVRDAGTEANTEMDAAFLNQTAGNTGMSTQENISMHLGFNGSLGNPDATPVNILSGTVASGDVIDAVHGDFTNSNYKLMRITVSKNTTPVRLRIKNAAMTDGTFLTPFWVAFHNGEFDTYNLGSTASAGLERMAEDGDASLLSEEFALSVGNDGIDAVITNPEGFQGAPLFDPGLSTEHIIELDPMTNRYFSYVSMVLPSNDAFIGNADPKRHKLFDEEGVFVGAVSFKVYGDEVNDAGTELNNESGAPFFNMDDPSINTSDSIMKHLGFNGSVGNPEGMPQVFLGNTNPPGFLIDQVKADFSREGYQVAEIAISRLIEGSFSGTWFNSETDGQGFVIDVTSEPTSNNARAVVSWYTYNADGTGTQSWIVGTGPVIADTIIADMMITEGTVFGTGFNSDDVAKSPWGQVNIKFNNCHSATVTFNSLDTNYGSGSLELQRLTKGPVDFKGACQL